MFKDKLKQFVIDNPTLVKMRETSKLGVFVLKYSRKVFYDNLWNEYLEECRGTIIDADYNLISYPFRKIYNYGIEASAPTLADDTVVTAYRKVNGFMASITWWNDDILVSTTGSVDSDFVKYIYDSIDVERYRAVCKQYPDYTFMFECVHPSDPHIIPEVYGMYLIGYRVKEWLSTVDMNSLCYDTIMEGFDCHGVESCKIPMSTLMVISKLAKNEGFVFYDSTGVSAKIKSPYYLVQKAIARKKDIMSLNKAIIPEEYYPLVDHINGMKDEFNILDEQTRLEYMRRFLNNMY
jgi:hypothetical protein